MWTFLMMLVCGKWLAKTVSSQPVHYVTVCSLI